MVREKERDQLQHHVLVFLVSPVRLGLIWMRALAGNFNGRLYACVVLMQGDGAALASALVLPTRPERVRE